MEKNQFFETKATFYFPDLNGKDIVDTEVAPVVMVDEKNAERTEDESEADFWSVYIRVATPELEVNPIDCILDLPTKEEAVKFEAFLRNLLKLDQQPQDSFY